MDGWGRLLSRLLSAAAVSLAALGAAAPLAGAGSDPSSAKQWGLSLIEAPIGWSAGTGNGILIAVVDTGVDLGHDDLKAKLVAGRNVLEPASPPQDDNGHGTHVAGTAAASTGNGLGVAGVAPGASILPVKVLGAGGRGSSADIAAGIRWAADSGAHVINLSLGPNAVIGALFGNGLEEDVDYAWSKGSIVVIAAGNDALFPSSAGDVPAVVVTATTRQDERASYASVVGSARWGISAPGGADGSNDADDILSTYWRRTGPASTYGYLAGTSMATPHVAGAAAILRGMGLSPQQTVDRLLGTAKDLGAPGRDNTFGSGRLDLACAVGRCGGLAPAVGEESTAAGSGTANSDGAGATTSGSGTGNTGSDASGAPGDLPAASGARAPASGAGPAAGRSGGGRVSSKLPGGAPRSGVPPPTLPAPAPTTASPSSSGAVTGEGVAVTGGRREAAPGFGDPTSSNRALAAADRGPSLVLTAAAGGLLLLVASSGLRLRRRRRQRQPS